MQPSITFRKGRPGDIMDILLENIKKSYEGRTVLNVSKSIIKSGRITAVIGPNGAGKSTLLRMISGIEKPDHGRITFDGYTDIPQKEITLVFQKPYLLSSTVEKNIAYPLKLRKFNTIESDKRVMALMKELGLTDLRKKKAWKLSGGETQKTALARALSFRPEVLMLDEPTANIDPYSTSEIERILTATNKKYKTTIIIVTHNLAQARRICDDAVMMHNGHILEYGSCEKLLTSPDNTSTRKFIEGELLI